VSVPNKQGQWRRSPLPPNWKRKRQHVLYRDLGVCQLGYRGCLGAASEVDHIGEHDDHRLDNLQAVCTRCHATKTGRQGNASKKPVKRPADRHPGLID